DRGSVPRKEHQRGYVPGPLGARGIDVLQRKRAAGALSPRRVRRISWLVEPRAAASGGLQGRVSANVERSRYGRVRGVCGWICGRRWKADGAWRTADGIGRRA